MLSITRRCGWWIAVLAVAICWRGILLISNTVSFHSDEAIVGLMARHILHGQPIPVFFYGQPYMGSLDPLLVSVMFRLTGEGVMGIRLTQAALYVLTVGTAMLLAYDTSKDRWSATVAGLLLALPTPLLALYTTISLGGYGETLLLGNLVLLFGWQIAAGKPGWWRWAALGGLAGVGWWTNNLIVVYLLPVGLFVLRARRGLSPLHIGVAGLAFLIGSLPWWGYNLTHDWESIRFLLGGFQNAAGGSTASVGITDRLIGFLLLGLPAVLGVRYSWTFQAWAGPFAFVVLIAYVLCVILSFRRSAATSAATLYAWVLAGIVLIFVLSSFGVDSTGRYLLPMSVPLAILVAAGTRRLPTTWGRLVPLAILLGINLVGTITAMRTVPPGLTPQFDPATDFTNDTDQQVIAFLREHGGTTGYGTYWASYRLAFLSGESVILSPQLPYKATLLYTPTDRYPAYTAAVEKVERPVLVSANLPQLDQAIAERLNAKGIGFSQQQIGPYTIFYDLSARVNPAELGLHTLR